jgi:RNA polymerase sigma-70 factor (ECF subfamily)
LETMTMGIDDATPTTSSDAALSEFFEQTVDSLYRYASRLCGSDRATTEDLVQETYVCLLREVRSGRPLDMGPGWLITTCRSRFIDRLRAERRRRTREGGAWSTGEQGSSVATPGFETSVLAGLTGEQRAALVLRYIDDLPVPEVARLLGKSVHATESLLARARAAARARIERNG